MATEAGTRPPERSAADGGSVVDDDTGEPGAPHHTHPTEGTYIKIALFLAFITAVEVLVYYIESIEDYLVAILITLSLVKFAIVVGLSLIHI